VCEPVGVVEIAQMLGLSHQTVTNIRHAATIGAGGAHPFPPARWTVGGRVPVWDWRRDILPWARETGRLVTDVHTRPI